MELDNIKIKGFRSFRDTKETEVLDLKITNLLIGPNNVGKTNVIRAIKRTNYYLKDYGAYGKYDSSSCKYRVADIEKICNEEDFFNRRNPKFTVLLGFKNGDILTWEYSNCAFEISGKDESGNYLSQQKLEEYFNYLSNNIIFLDENRNLISNLKSTEKIIDKLLEQEVKEEISRIWEEDEDKFEDYLERGFNNIFQDKFGFKFTNNEEKDLIDNILIRTNSKNKFISMRNLGSGLSQVFIILTLSYRYNYGTNQKIFFIDEPENNLHPEILIRLFHFLKTEGQSKHKYLIVTHSPWLIDQEKVIDQIYMVTLKNHTNIKSIYEDNNSIRYILDTIGARSSQLLQSNIVIWVEGPSDRIYINHWIKLYQEYKNVDKENLLIEGKHYNFIMYGGSLLFHYDLDSNELIDFLKASRYAYIIMDSDIDNSKRKEYKNSVNRIVEKIDKHKGLQRTVGYWITAGKEIENYVPHKVFLRIFKDKKYNRISADEARLKPKQPNGKKIWNDYYAHLFRKDNTIEISKIKATQMFRKTIVANEVAEVWDSSFGIKSDLSNDDLINKIEDLINYIKSANNI